MVNNIIKIASLAFTSFFLICVLLSLLTGILFHIMVSIILGLVGFICVAIATTAAIVNEIDKYENQE